MAQAVPDNTPQFRIGISSSMNTFFDETLLFFEAGVPAFDQFDVIKPPFGTTGAPQVSTVSADGANLIMNAYGAVWQEVAIPMKVKAGVTGIHTLRFFDGPGYLAGTCVKLEDTQTGSFTVINEGDSVDVMLNTNDPVDPPRFKLHITSSNTEAHSDVSCFGLNDGEIAILGGGNGPWTYDWYGPGGIFIQTQAGHNGVSKLDNASAGVYRVDITGTSGCGMRSSFVEITSPPAIQADLNIVDEHCTLISNGSITASGMGGVPPYTYTWGHGGTDSLTSGLAAGLYDLFIHDATGCSRYFPAIEVLTTGKPHASIKASADHALINEPIYFENGNHTGVEFMWSFGDGTISELEKPQHAYALPGIYEVQLILSEANCVDSATAILEVGANGINDIGPFSDVQVIPQETGVQINGADYVLDQSTVSIIDAVGREVLQTRRLGSDRFIPIDLRSAGIYRVILTNAAGRKAVPISILR